MNLSQIHRYPYATTYTARHGAPQQILSLLVKGIVEGLPYRIGLTFFFFFFHLSFWLRAWLEKGFSGEFSSSLLLMAWRGLAEYADVRERRRERQQTVRAVFHFALILYMRFYVLLSFTYQGWMEGGIWELGAWNLDIGGYWICVMGVFFFFF